jgi:hypothetical protein
VRRFLEAVRDLALFILVGIPGLLVVLLCCLLLEAMDRTDHFLDRWWQRA